MRRVFLAFLLLLLLVPANSALAQEKRLALVIGNAVYSVGPLRNPANDSRAMAKALRETGFEVIERQNLTRRQMLAALREFGGAITPDTVAVFYYAGHGIQSRGANYLIPVDAQFESEGAIDEESVNVNAVLARLEEGRARVSMVILDACRDNPFERRFRTLGRGLAQQDAPAGSLIAFATSPGSTAADGIGENGLYTEELLSAMQAPGLKVEELFKRVRIEVQRRSAGRQVPWENTSLTGEFYFRPLGPQRTESAAIAAPAGAANPYELLFWQSIMNSNRPQDFDEYLRQFPSGVFAGLAGNRAAALRQEAQAGIAARQQTPPPAATPSAEEEAKKAQALAREEAARKQREEQARREQARKDEQAKLEQARKEEAAKAEAAKAEAAKLEQARKDEQARLAAASAPRPPPAAAVRPAARDPRRPPAESAAAPREVEPPPSPGSPSPGSPSPALAPAPPPQQSALLTAPKSFALKDVQGRWSGGLNALSLTLQVNGSVVRGTMTCYSDKYHLQGSMREDGSMTASVGGIGGGAIRVNGTLPVLNLEFFVSPSGIAICDSGKLSMTRRD